MKLASILPILLIQTRLIQHATTAFLVSPFSMQNYQDSSKRRRLSEDMDQTPKLLSRHGLDVQVVPGAPMQRLEMVPCRNNLMNTTSISESDGQAHDSSEVADINGNCKSLNVLCEIISRTTAHDKVMINALKVLEELSIRAALNMEGGGDNNLKKQLKERKRVGLSIEFVESSQINRALAGSGLEAARMLRQLMFYHGPKRGKGRKALISTTSFMIDQQSQANTLALITIVSALALPRGTNHPDFSDDEHRSVSRAAVSGLLPSGRHQALNKSSNTENDLDKKSPCTDSHYGEQAVLVILDKVASAASMDVEAEVVIDLHIVTSLARAFVSDRTPSITSTCAACIRETLRLSSDALSTGTYYQLAEVNKFDITGALGLAAFLAPWSRISPVLLVEISMGRHFWHAAERLCESAVQFNSPDACEAIHAFIDGLSERRMYRQSDVIATKFYKDGGMSKYAEVRYMHACDTIAKVVIKRQFPIVERQVERVDRACARVRNDNVNDHENNLDMFPEEVRVFVLTKLRDIGEHDTAHRLAKLWSMEYSYNENDAKKFIAARLAKYVQWKDAFPCIPSEIPELISNPEDLVSRFNHLLQTADTSLPVIIGFDVEWGDESEGAALLQLSTIHDAILVDIPALLKTVQGCDALEETVGSLFARRLRHSAPIIAAGFSCQEDIMRLRASVGIRASHWFTSSKGFVDIKPIIADDQPSLKYLGLSRVCDFYLGKPLDKAEQCSSWDRRPLSESQRIYAALDAWVVTAICSKLPDEALVKEG